MLYPTVKKNCEREVVLGHQSGLSCKVLLADDRSPSVELPTLGKRVLEWRGVPAGRDRRPSRTAVIFTG